MVEAAGLGNQSRHKGSVVRGFESLFPDVRGLTIYDCTWDWQISNMVIVAQLVEHQIVVLRVAGSMPVFHPKKRDKNVYHGIE